MTVSKKIKIINNKIEQSKAQYKLGRKTFKILALSSQNVNKYEFLTDKEVLLEKDKKLQQSKDLNICYYTVS